MSWIPVSLVSRSTGLRSALRRAGVTKRLAVLRPFISGSDYEGKVDAALQALVRPGDVVWDVGANVGLYTERFARSVGEAGRVIAFEPIEKTHAALSERVRSYAQASCRMEALGAAEGTVDIALDADPTSATNTLANQPVAGAQKQTVTVVIADQLVRSGAVPAPSVVKIDTEGFEEDVLWGMRETLRSATLRGLMIEVHFALLERRGYRRAPDRIRSLLQDAGFRCEWVDASHLLARRP